MLELSLYWKQQLHRKYQFKGKDSEIKPYSRVLEMFQKILQPITWKEKTGSNGYVYDFPVDNNVIESDDIINIHNYLMKKYDIK